MPFHKMKAALVFALYALALPAQAQPWPRTPDGGVVLTIQGNRVVIPKEMLENGSFSNIPSIERRPSGTSLRDIIADPDRFRPLLDNKIGGVSFSYNIGWLAESFERRGLDVELVRKSPWLGRFGVSTFEHGLSGTREQRTKQQCGRSFMGDQWYEYRNISRLITNEGAPHPRRVFRACAGQFLIHYSIYPHWYVDIPLPVIQDRLVEFFKAMLPDTPIEVFP